MSATPLLSVDCICCGNEQWLAKFEILQQCEKCGFIRADSSIEASKLEELYSEAYFCGDEYADYLADRQVHEKNFRYRLQQLLKVHDQPRAVFEIGCAYGLFLETCFASDISARGVDISQAPTEYARQKGLDAVHGDFLRLELFPFDYDCFCMWDVIEHLPYPEKFVERIWDLLPPGGTLIFTTGDIESKNAMRRGKNWRMIHPPTHLQYFGHRTVDLFLQRFGFEQIQIESVSMYRNAHSVLSALSVFNRGWLGTTAGWLHRLIPSGIQKLTGGWLDLGDIMLVSAKKPLKTEVVETV